MFILEAFDALSQGLDVLRMGKIIFDKADAG